MAFSFFVVFFGRGRGKILEFVFCGCHANLWGFDRFEDLIGRSADPGAIGFYSVVNETVTCSPHSGFQMSSVLQNSSRLWYFLCDVAFVASTRSKPLSGTRNWECTVHVFQGRWRATDYGSENVYLLWRTCRDQNWQLKILLSFLSLEESANVYGTITLDIDRWSMSSNVIGCGGQDYFVSWSTSCSFVLIHEFLNQSGQNLSMGTLSSLDISQQKSICKVQLY